MSRKYLIIATAALGLLIGLGAGCLVLWPGMTPPKACYPAVRLEYLYIKVFNASSGAGPLSNSAILTYVAVVDVVSNCDFTFTPEHIRISIPEDVYVGTCSKQGNATISVTVALSTRKSQITGERLEARAEAALPSKGYLVLFNSSVTKCIPTFGEVNDLLRHDYGVTYFPTRNTEYFILPGQERRFVLTGAVPVPEPWVGRLGMWLENGTYVAIELNGKGVDVKGYVEALVVLKVRLERIGTWEYVYGSLPEGLWIG